ncbi:MAG: ABC transporter substrate-binding protein [Pyrinomonadaceae bacterium]
MLQPELNVKAIIHRSFGRTLIGVALCFLLFSCGTNRPAGNEDELIIGVRADDYVVEPLKSKLGMYPLNGQICEPLVRITPDYDIEPLLATRWERHGNTWRFFLRPNVVFSNGQPLTSEAVKYTVARLVKGDRAGIYQHTYLGENSVSAVDELTVDLTPERPNQHLLEQIGHANYSIIAPGTEPATLPVGTGPFKLVEYRRGEWLKTERNERYWGERPGLRRLTFRFLPDDTTRVLALQAGEADMILDVPREQAATLRAQAGTSVIEAPVGRVAAIFLNIHGKSPYDLLANKNLRRAIGSSIDRSMLIEKVWEGNGELIATMGPRAMLGGYASLVEGSVFDKDRAKHLLAQEGWLPGADGVRVRNGRRLILTMIAWPEFDTATLEFIQAQLATSGIELRIVRSPDSASYQARIESGEFDLDLEAPNQNDGNPMFLPALRFFSKSSGKTVRYFAPGDRFDAIIEAGLETDRRDETMSRSAEAQRVLVNEEAIVIPLAGLKRIYAMRIALHGFAPHPSLLNQRWDTISTKR